MDSVLSPGTPQQNNGYSYAHNNPSTLSDPSGLEPKAPDGYYDGKYYDAPVRPADPPPAPGASGSYDAASPHVGINPDNPYLGSMTSAYGEYTKDLRPGATLTEDQEVHIWLEICTVSPGVCDPSFFAMIQPLSWMANDYALNLEASLAAGTIFFFSSGNVGPSFRIDSSVGENSELTVRHYTTEAGGKGIAQDGFIKPGKLQLTWLTPDTHASGLEAQRALALPTTPDGWFDVPWSRITNPSAQSIAEPKFNQPGGGIEFTTDSPISVEGLEFRRF